MKRAKNHSYKIRLEANAEASGVYLTPTLSDKQAQDISQFPAAKFEQTKAKVNMLGTFMDYTLTYMDIDRLLASAAWWSLRDPVHFQQSTQQNIQFPHLFR